jgi:hypothetical protein
MVSRDGKILFQHPWRDEFDELVKECNLVSAKAGKLPA